MAWTSETGNETNRFETETEEKSDGIQTRNEILSAQQLSNPLILKKVLGFLDNASDLLNCRAVGPDWKSLATEILLQRKCVTISLMYNKKRGAYFKGNKKRDKWMFHAVNKECFPLQNLVGLIKSESTALENPGSGSGSGFPCSSFLIFGGDLEADDISSFFHLYGGGVKKLKLLLNPVPKWFYSGGCGGRRACVPFELPKISTLRNILCLQLPNLRELEILSDDYRRTWRTYFDEDFAFHHLFQEFEITCKPEFPEFPEFQPASNPTPKPSGTPTALSPGTQEKKEKIIIIMSRLGKLEKLGLNIDDYHDFHEDPEYSDSFDPPKSVIQKNLYQSKSVEFIDVSKRDYMNCGDCLTALMSSKQIDQLRTLSLPAVGLEIMERMINEFPSQLRLDELTIDFSYETIGQLKNSESMKKRMIRGLVAIFKIVATNSPKLCVHLTSVGFLSDADFFIPSMENVSDLRLDLLNNQEDWIILNSNPNPLEPGEHADQDQPRLRFEMDLEYRQFFPCGFNLSDSFPNLQSIELDLGRRDITADFWGQNCQSLPTVQSFSLSCYAPFGAGKLLVPGYLKLSEIFPNLTKIQLSELTDFPAVASCLWKFKELEELVITLDVSAHSPGNSKTMGAIDSAITGFTTETLQELRGSEEFMEWAGIQIDRIKLEAAEEAAGKKVQGERKGKGKKQKKREKIPLQLPQWLSLDMESLRVNPSICDLPKLEKLSVEFVDGGRDSNKSYFLMSKMSFLLAFGLMPQLEVTILSEARRVSNRKRIVTQLWDLLPLVKSFDVDEAYGVQNAQSPEDIYYYDPGSDSDSDLEAEQFSD